MAELFKQLASLRDGKIVEDGTSTTKDLYDGWNYGLFGNISGSTAIGWEKNLSYGLAPDATNYAQELLGRAKWNSDNAKSTDPVTSVDYKEYESPS